MLRSIFLILVILMLPAVLSAEAPQISVITVNGPINPVIAGYFKRNLKEAASRGDRLLLVEMDTPGGLDLAMREIVKDMFASPVPVAVFVAPSGARAASAGAVIALAADVSAMAPGTNIGAAHPVTIGQPAAIGDKPDKVMQEKIMNDAEAYVEGIAAKRGRNTAVAKKMVRESISLSADKALAENVIDLIANDRQALLKSLEGRRLVRDGKETNLQLGNAVVRQHEMGGRERVLNTISDPNVAYILLMIGLLGIFFELSNPGVILPGVIGGISLLLAFFAFQTLPVNYAGVLLILLAIVLLIAEIKIVSHGMLTVGGVVAMAFGSLLLFQSPEPYLRLSLSVILVTVLITTLFFVVVVAKVLKAHHHRPFTGSEGMIGEQGVAETDIMPVGKALLRGEYWDATSPEPVSKGDRVEVIAVEGLRIKVKKL